MEERVTGDDSLPFEVYDPVDPKLASELVSSALVLRVSMEPLLAP